MDVCMTMPGGGPWNTGPGQITDDSELGMCLMRALVDGNQNNNEGESILPTKYIAKYYM